jgi:hypothetical protein
MSLVHSVSSSYEMRFGHLALFTEISSPARGELGQKEKDERMGSSELEQTVENPAVEEIDGMEDSTPQQFHKEPGTWAVLISAKLRPAAGLCRVCPIGGGSTGNIHPKAERQKGGTRNLNISSV